MPIVDHHDRVFSRKGRRVTLIEGLVNFHALGEGPQGHEILHHAAVPELVLDRVSVVRDGLLQEPLKVVCGWSHLTLTTACDVVVHAMPELPA
jgi:hypothetical protein